MGVRLLVVLLLRRILLLAVWVVLGRRSASWLSSIATAIHHHLLLLLLLLQDSPVLPVEHLYGLLVRQEGRIGMELLQEDDSPGLRDVQAVHGLKVCRQAQKCGVRQHDGSFSTGYSPEPKSAPQSLALSFSVFTPLCLLRFRPPHLRRCISRKLSRKCPQFSISRLLAKAFHWRLESPWSPTPRFYSSSLKGVLTVLTVKEWEC